MTTADHCLSLERAEAIAAADPASPDEAQHLARCTACRDTVDHIREDNALFAGALGAFAELRPLEPPSDADAPPGYTFIEEIHRGAQGVVFLAEQARTNRRVAVKLTLRGAFATVRQRARFDREVELAASLKHPAIVTVFESGATRSGGRYMAMEYVDGRTLSDWFTARVRTPKDVAAVMAQIARALDAAHRKGVIHRDLKPSNVLIDLNDQPKVVDFGIAKALREHERSETQAGEFVGTLAYAAPEQVAGDADAVDTRADVYALGTLLYEGLAGVRPLTLSGSLTDCLRVIQHTTPPPPSAHAAAVPADLDAVTLKALEKTPSDRYPTAGALADDLERFVKGEAVAARAHDRAYRLRKWARERRRVIAIGAVFLLAALAASVLGANAYLSAQRADAERAGRQWATDALLRPLAAADTELSNEAVTSLSDYLVLMADTLAEELPGSPELEAAVRSRIGIALTRESDFASAEPQLSRALELYLRASDTGTPEIAEALHNLARMHWKKSDYAAAEPLYRQALELRRRLLPPGDLTAARTAHHLASTLQRLGRFDEAVALYRDALDARRDQLGPDHPEVANTLNGLGECYSDFRRFDEALDYYRDGRRIIAAAVGESDWRTASATASIARCLIDLGRREEARPLFEQSLAVSLKWWPEDDPRVTRTRLALAVLDRKPAAVAAILRTIEQRQGPAHSDTALAYADLAATALAVGDPDAALSAARHARDLQIQRDPAGWRAAEARLLEAEALLHLERHQDARDALALARPSLDGHFSDRDPLLQTLARLSAAAAEAR